MKLKFYPGVFEGKTTGTPIGFMIKNRGQRSKDYTEIKNVYARLMRIIHGKQNLDIEIIEGAEDLQQEKQPPEW